MRAEYVAGGIGLRALAARHGVSHYAARKRAKAEDWVRARDEAGGRRAREAGPAAGGGERGSRPLLSASEAGDGELVARLRHKLLLRIDHVASAIPRGAVTELKTQDDEGVKLFKLRDLTAAYKDLAGDLAKGEDADIEDLGPLEELLK